MTAKEYLRQLSRKDARIDALIERQRRYRELAERRTTVYRDTPGGGRRCSSSVEEYVVKIIDLEREIDRRIDEYVGPDPRDRDRHRQSRRRPLPGYFALPLHKRLELGEDRARDALRRTLGAAPAWLGAFASGDTR